MARFASDHPRPAPDSVAALAELGVSTVHEAMGRTGLLHHAIRPIADGMTVAGPAVTVEIEPGDNLMVHVGIELCRPGDVLVVGSSAAGDGQRLWGVFGEQLAVSMRSRGAAGIVLDAGCRDVAALRDLQFPVFSRGISASGTTKEHVGTANSRIECAGASVAAGDVVIGDDDGVVIVPHRDVAAIIEAGRQKAEIEAVGLQLLSEGSLSLDLLNLRAKLEER